MIAAYFIGRALLRWLDRFEADLAAIRGVGPGKCGWP